MSFFEFVIKHSTNEFIEISRVKPWIFVPIEEVIMNSVSNMEQLLCLWFMRSLNLAGGIKFL